MSNAEWGIKRVCPSCSIKYYDFNKDPIICPKCEFKFDPDLLLKSRKGRSIATKTADNVISNNEKKETETLEADIDSLENDQEILDIDDGENISDDEIGNDIDKNISDDNDDLEIIDNDLNDKDEFSIEINDETDENVEDEK